MKFLIVVVFVQLMMLGAGIYGAVLVHDAIKTGVVQMPSVVHKQKVELRPRYQPSVHQSAALHKFEASVKHTE